MKCYRMILAAITLSTFASANGESLTVTGVVLGPSGKPAPYARLNVLGFGRVRTRELRTNKIGRFEITDPFLNGCAVHFSNQDGTSQSSLFIPASAVRSRAKRDIRIQLRESRIHTVELRRPGNRPPKKDVRVVLSGAWFFVQGTMSEGESRSFRIPKNGELNSVVCWHPRVGIAGDWGHYPAIETVRSKLSLAPSSRHRIVATDPDGRPVANIMLGVSVMMNRKWLGINRIVESHVKTDQRGTAYVDWVPKSADRIGVRVVDQSWTLESLSTAPKRGIPTAIQLRRLRTIKGKVLLPHGASARGMLINGAMSGSGSQFLPINVRAAEDGSFTILSARDYLGSFGIADREWTSNAWKGALVTQNANNPNVELTAQKAHPLRLSVFQGNRPQANAMIRIQHVTDLANVNESGHTVPWSSGPSQYAYTDTSGFATLGVRKGHYSVFVKSGHLQQNVQLEVKPERQSKLRIELR